MATFLLGRVGMWIHLTARERTSWNPFLKEEAARWIWAHLRSAFPEAVSAVLMPNHLQLLTLSEDPNADRLTVARLLGGVSTRLGEDRGRWDPVPAPSAIPDRDHLRRQVRYVALNPCRKGLVADPLGWQWTTHTDVCGAVVDPWVPAERLAQTLGQSGTRFAERHHAYVSADSSVRVQGTPFPKPVVASIFPSVPLERIAGAAALATHSPIERVRSRSVCRTLFLQSSWHQGWRDFETLARRASVRAASVREAVRRVPDPGSIGAVLLRLGDTRLS